MEKQIYGLKLLKSIKSVANYSLFQLIDVMLPLHWAQASEFV